MAKNLKFKIKDIDKLEFELEENGSTGDYISILDQLDKNFESVKSTINYKIKSWENDFKKEFNEKEKIHSINEFKLSSEFTSLIEDKNLSTHKIKELEEKLEGQKNAILNEFKLSNEFAELQKIKIEFSSLKNNYEQQIKSLNENHHKDLEMSEFKIKDELNKKSQIKIDALELEKNYLTNELERRKTRNIKVMGEEFEEWILNAYNNSDFSMSSDTNLEKANKTIGSSKPDFIFTVYDKDANNSTLEKIVIEAKTEGNTGKTKNQDHYEKLDKDRHNNDAQYSLLISELEPNQEFMIKMVPNYQNMFVIRPGYFLSFLALIKHIALKKKTITSANLNFKRKEEILEEFNNMKNKILSNSVEQIEKNTSIILDQAVKIRDSVAKIEENGRKIVDRHIETIKNKIENFKIEKIIKKIEKDSIE